ncbi:CIC11C00000001675 [Sungouiella intermedia]|uniref:CIC11C00000001675 n=1 Tax=Sungouiella intermedia TaxID=45354 RepID=A0A1L0BUB7_9ASCO|nr:CIC11C00000001675 [[Candida] intermedia]
MADPSEVVLRYTPEKWIEAQERLGSAGEKHVQPLNSTSKEFFVRPISESLDRLGEYGKNPLNDVQVLEKNWYYDLTNVGQRLRLLRETFKVLQLVRKKRMMGERADFKMLNEFRLSHTGSPIVLDDDGLSKTEDEDDNNTSSVPEFPPPPPPKQRGRPRRKHTRGRKPGYRRETADPPVTRTRASRRGQDSTLLPLLREQAVATLLTTNGNGDGSNLVYTSPTEALSTFPILHLPPILPSQRLPENYTQAINYGGALTYGSNESLHVKAPKFVSGVPEENQAKQSRRASSTPVSSKVGVAGDSSSFASASPSVVKQSTGENSHFGPILTLGGPSGPHAMQAQANQAAQTSIQASNQAIPSQAHPSTMATPAYHSAHSTKLSTPNLATQTTTSNVTTNPSPPNLTNAPILHSSTLPGMRMPNISDRLLPTFAGDSRGPLPRMAGMPGVPGMARMSGMTGTPAISHTPAGYMGSQGGPGIRLPPLQWGSGNYEMPGIPHQSPPSMYSGPSSEDKKE